MKNLPTYILILTLLMLYGCISISNKKVTEVDVVIYGGTSAAVTTAVQVAKMGQSVIIVCPEKHLGGMTSSGLGFTDTGNKEVIGGLTREFYQRIFNHYEREEAWNWQEKNDYGNKGQGTPAIDGDKRTMWIFEPHMAEQVFEDFIKEYDIPVERNHWLDRENGVEVMDGKITSITMLNGKTFKGKIFVDATYEGDLMAAAGITYHVGREANKVYGESWNGIQTGVLHHKHHFADRHISPYIISGDPSSGILPRIAKGNPGSKGAGDSKVQAYCYRLCLTNVEANRVPFERPDGYDSTQYELLVRILNDGWRETFQKFDPIPNYKTDVNNHGPFSFDNIGMNYDYPEASYETRQEIIEEHINYQKGLLYFYATDSRIPTEIQQEMKTWGLAKDEFADNENWPYQIYVREARRMIGSFVMTENEVLGKAAVPNPIGMGSYTMDSHNTQRYITSEGYVQNEGDIGVHPNEPYQIAMGSILPQEKECKNLLVPVAVSSSHIAFGSIRMEPVFMIIGQSAGIIASIAIESGKDIHELDYNRVKDILIQEGQILE